MYCAYFLFIFMLKADLNVFIDVYIFFFMYVWYVFVLCMDRGCNFASCPYSRDCALWHFVTNGSKAHCQQVDSLFAYSRRATPIRMRATNPPLVHNVFSTQSLHWSRIRILWPGIRGIPCRCTLRSSTNTLTSNMNWTNDVG